MQSHSKDMNEIGASRAASYTTTGGRGMGGQQPPCKTHADAPHGFLRNASHEVGRYVCECEFWTAPYDRDLLCAGTRMKTIIEMAREAGMELTVNQHGNQQFRCFSRELERFAELVRADERDFVMNEPITKAHWQRFENDIRADEREACAKLCEEQEYHYWRATEDQDFTPQDCANAIRARGNT